MSITDGQQRTSSPAAGTRTGLSKNWKWLAFLALGPVCVAATFVAASHLKSPANYDLKPPVPAGYRAVANPYYAFSVPKSWKENSAKSDENGDLFYQGRSGTAGETTAITKTRPPSDEPIPSIITLYFEPHYRVVSRRQAVIPHATLAQIDTLRAANGRSATLYHGWVKRTQTEFWVLFSGSPATVSKMAATLVA